MLLIVCGAVLLCVALAALFYSLFETGRRADENDIRAINHLIEKEEYDRNKTE